MLTLYDEFAGVGGSTRGATRVPGVTPLLAINHWQVAVDSHAANFPQAAHDCLDVKKIDMAKMPRADIFWASPACFTAGTLILTRRGLIPIEDVQVDDEAFTHMRRWRPVTHVMRRTAPTVVVRGVGLPAGIETTAEHPFYTRRRVRAWHNPSRRYRMEISDAAEWTEAKDLIGHAWATPIDFGDQGEVPPVAGRGIEFDADFWWVVGRWLGDGHLRAQPRRSEPKPRGKRPACIRSQNPGSTCTRCDNPARPYGKGTTDRLSPFCSDTCAKKRTRPGTYDPLQSRYDLTISCGHHEAEDLAKRLDAIVSLTWHARVKRTATTFTTSHRGLVEWLATNFGQHAHGKTIPAWALTMPTSWREALLAGYLSADGNIGKYTEATTVSKRLAVGVRMLANTLGHVANIKGPYSRPAARTIEGRHVNERPAWQVAWLTGGPQHIFHADADGYRWAPVKDVTATGRTAEVFNFTVAEDESYLADGIMVHNCPPWTDARGKKRDFDKQTVQQGTLFGEQEPDENTKRARALMEEVPKYLEAMALRGKPVLVGVVENVIQCRLWADWDRWIRRIELLGYRTRLIAFNSMHAAPPVSRRAPQSRDRLYLAYWHQSLGRDPDWDKWLRPAAYCPGCDTAVRAMQVFKKPGQDMGRYRSQYLYRCPSSTCRHHQVEPAALPALVAIDPTIPGGAIKDRAKPLADATLDRIKAGIRRWWLPLLTPAGGTWRDVAMPLTDPMPTRTTRDTDAIAVPPLLVPVEGRPGKTVAPGTAPWRTQTARQETALTQVPLPFITPLRGGGCKDASRSILDPVGTVTASGNHHGLALPPLLMRNLTARGDQGQMVTPADEPARTVTASNRQSLLTWHQQLLVPYYGAADAAAPAAQPVGALTARDRYGIAQPSGADYSDRDVDEFIGDVLFRMLEPHEIAAAMAFDPDYKTVATSNRDKTRLFGNAVTPPVAELIVSALVEAVTGEALEVGA